MLPDHMSHTLDRFAVRSQVVEYHQIQLPVLCLELNGQFLSNRAAPFTAAADSIHTQVCEECYAGTCGQSPSCGQADIAVRRHGELIYWYLIDPDINPANLPPRQIWSFARADYEQQLSGNATSLPPFDSAEIECLLNRCNLFSPSLGLYTLPDLPADPQGRGFLAAVEHVVRAGGFEIAAAPAHSQLIRVGIETPGVPECVVELALHGERCVIRFVENPDFPLWVTSAEVQRQMARYRGC